MWIASSWDGTSNDAEIQSEAKENARIIIEAPERRLL